MSDFIFLYTTKRNASGNRYTLSVNYDKKTFHRDINNAWSYSDYIEITKKDRDKIIEILTRNGFSEI